MRPDYTTLNLLDNLGNRLLREKLTLIAKENGLKQHQVNKYILELGIIALQNRESEKKQFEELLKEIKHD